MRKKSKSFQKITKKFLIKQEKARKVGNEKIFEKIFQKIGENFLNHKIRKLHKNYKLKK